MILSDTEILAAIQRGDIVIDPFDVNQLGGNSYDVRLGPVLRVYETIALWTACIAWKSDADNGLAMLWENRPLRRDGDSVATCLDCAIEPRTLDIPIPIGGCKLVPGVLYLASTVEYTETHTTVPHLDGKSSIGRLGIFIHATAGRGDVGFKGHWTLELSVVQPVRVYAGMPIGQLTYHLVHGEVERAYQTKPGASYLDGRDPMPQPSRLWKKLQAKR